jgi:hypothetical protein
MRLDQGARVCAARARNPIKNIPCFGVAGLTLFLVNGHPMVTVTSRDSMPLKRQVLNKRAHY